jgi:parallel beta-helix repeat protein
MFSSRKNKNALAAPGNPWKVPTNTEARISVKRRQSRGGFLIGVFSSFALIATFLVFSGTAVTRAAATSCTQTGFFRDGINMTAAQIGGSVTGSLDAGGCNIGVYYDSTHPGNVTSATIFGANYFGVVVNGDVGAVSVNVTDSNIHDIGETPLNGDQHGAGIYYRSLTTFAATGTISGNTLTNYQKGGIVVNGNVTAMITNNIVTGQGPVDYIAQNGIQLGYGAKGTVTNNTVTGNAYTGANLASSGGIIVIGGPCFGPPNAYTVGLTIATNTLTNNDVGVWLLNANESCRTPSTKTDNTVKSNTISNDAVTNTTGFSATCGYQVGVADVGHTDSIVSNAISGFGYTPTVGGDCTGSTPAFLRFIDKSSTRHASGTAK